MILIDSSMWIEFFAGSDLGKIIRDNPEFKKNEFLVPTIVVFEVHKKLLYEYNEGLANEYTLYLQNGTIIDFNYNLAIIASQYSKETKLPMADSIIYITAMMYNSILYTTDKHFKDLKNVKYFEK
ncbi:MAG: type II toxin-antitoxin system VapC family toxin [bacterium]